ncbi:hypothetical protein NQ318_012656 [Aromia moschata]|uniref:Transposase n=1 Tax=Aromia moschata TaxID=1265417 RepID=A0AAV8X915_9CUCU|nr:hypothetical protein NQ318_012656 [Aromia moschata]
MDRKSSRNNHLSTRYTTIFRKSITNGGWSFVIGLWVQQRPNLSLFSDESRFTNLGMFNKNNSRYWAREYPHLFRQGAFQERFGINVWMGVIGTRIVGPIFFENPLTADQYLQFLSNEIADFLENLPINEYFHIYYQQDGAPAHNARRVRDHLNQTFEDRWIDTYGPVRWPARSCDITPLIFSIGVTLKKQCTEHSLLIYKISATGLQERVNTAMVLPPSTSLRVNVRCQSFSIILKGQTKEMTTPSQHKKEDHCQVCGEFKYPALKISGQDIGPRWQPYLVGIYMNS